MVSDALGSQACAASGPRAFCAACAYIDLDSRFVRELSPLVLGTALLAIQAKGSLLLKASACARLVGAYAPCLDMMWRSADEDVEETMVLLVCCCLCLLFLRRMSWRNCCLLAEDLIHHTHIITEPL